MSKIEQELWNLYKVAVEKEQLGVALEVLMQLFRFKLELDSCT